MAEQRERKVKGSVGKRVVGRERGVSSIFFFFFWWILGYVFWGRESVGRNPQRR